MTQDLREALEAQIAEWRDKQERMNLPKSGLTGEGAVIKECADEVEELLQEQTDE